MANYNQFARVPVQGGDLPLKNNGVSDIPAGLGVLIDPSNDDGIVLPTASGGVAGSIGVTVSKILAGATGLVQLYGIAVCTASGTVTRGEDVQIDDTALKLGYVKTKGAAAIGLGVALNSAAEGYPVRVALFHAKNA